MTAADWDEGPWVVGLDLSLTSTGIAYANGTVEHLDTEKKKFSDDMARLGFIVDRVRGAFDVAEQDPDLVVIEGYTYATTKSAHVLGELGGIVRFELWSSGIPFAVIAPSKLKRYALGKGAGDKVAMVVAARERLAYGGLQDDEADALWLRALGLDLLGAPLVSLPKEHRGALEGVAVVGRREVPA